MVMKSDVVFLLSRGPKSETELAAFLGASQLPEINGILMDLKRSGFVTVRPRQIKRVDNVVFWDREFLLNTHASTAA